MGEGRATSGRHAPLNARIRTADVRKRVNWLTFARRLAERSQADCRRAECGHSATVGVRSNDVTA